MCTDICVCVCSGMVISLLLWIAISFWFREAFETTGGVVEDPSVLLHWGDKKTSPKVRRWLVIGDGL